MLEPMSDLDERLPFDQDRQYAILGHCLRNERFFMQVKDRIKPNWFMDGYVSKVYAVYCRFHDRFRRVPLSLEEFRANDELLSLNQAERLKIEKTIDRASALSEKFGLDYLAEQLTAWAKTQLILQQLPGVAKLVNNQKVTEAELQLRDCDRALQTTRFDGAPPVDFSDPLALLAQEEADWKDALTTGSSVLDSKLLPDNPSGALLRGDTTVLVAPYNVGKTSAMITIARHNLHKGKSVLWLTFEGRDTDLRIKMWSSFTKKTRLEWRNFILATDPVSKQSLEAVTNYLNSHLTYVPINKAGLTVEEVIGIIRMYQAQRQARYGKGYDLLVVDYPAILTTERGMKWDYRQVQDYIYRQFVQLALEERLHAMLACQANREGSKMNRKGHEEGGSLLTGDHIAEAIGIAQSATNIITVNRDEVAQFQNRMTLYLAKSRSSAAGWAVVCRSDFSRALTHSDELGATAYQGTSTSADRTEAMLREFRNKDAPLDFEPAKG